MIVGQIFRGAVHAGFIESPFIRFHFSPFHRRWNGTAHVPFLTKHVQ